MKTSTIDRSLARATLYKLLSYAFGYPSADVCEALRGALPAGEVSAAILGGNLPAKLESVIGAMSSRRADDLLGEYRATFSLSASPDCPLNECAYGARHLYQEMQKLADIAGFYKAFGLEIHGQRQDDLAAELEFCYLLTLKEAYAGERRERKNARLCTDAHRSFFRAHLGRWAVNIGKRVEVLAPDTAYAAFGSLLSDFAELEIVQLGIDDIEPYEDVPQPVEPPASEECAAEAGMPAFRFDEDDLIGNLMPVGTRPGKGEEK